jgi:hypothetical protein
MSNDPEIVAEYIRNIGQEKVTLMEELARLEADNGHLVAEMERLQPWIALLKHAPAANRQSIQERYLATEVINPIVQAWKDRVAQQENRIRELEAEMLGLRREIERLRTGEAA